MCVFIHFGLQLFEAYRSAVVCALEKGTNKHYLQVENIKENIFVCIN